MEKSHKKLALKEVLLSQMYIHRSPVTTDEYSHLINDFNLDNASWNRFLLKRNKKNNYLPWYDQIIGSNPEDDRVIYGPDTIIQIDGPNCEGGNKKGVLLEVHCFLDPYIKDGKPAATIANFYLYLLDKADNKRKLALKYAADVVPYKSTNWFDEILDCCCIASQRFFALATYSMLTYRHNLHIFHYSIDWDVWAEKRIKNVERIACLKNVPHFKKMCWLYGRNLVAIDQDKKLYVIGLNGHTVTLHKQAIPLNVDDIAVHFPQKPHEVLLLAQEKIYYANLARRDKKDAIHYRCIYPDSDVSLRDSIKGKMDKIWFYENVVTVAQQCDSTPDDTGKRFCNFVYLHIEYPLLEKIVAYLKNTNKKPVRKNRFLRSTIEIRSVSEPAKN